MPFKLPDRVFETFTTTGTGPVTLLGSQSGFRSFSEELATNDTTFYQMWDDTDRETGIGTYNSGTNALTRTSILSSTNGDAAVDWGPGTRNIIVGLPSVLAAALLAPGSTGFLAQTAAKTYARRTLTAGDNVTITNPAGIAGNPIIAVEGLGDLAYENLDADGMVPSIIGGTPIGAVVAYPFSTAPSGWLFVSGLTIGSAASGATAKAHAGMLPLYEKLWDEFDNTELVIQNSSGTPTTRGASAAADFAANKRLPLLDAQGRVIAGWDSMSGASANRLTSPINGDTIGAAGGSQSHTLIVAEMPEHDHTPGTLATSNSGGHTHNVIEGGDDPAIGTFNTSAITAGGGNGTQTSSPVVAVGDHAHTLSGATSVAGSDGSHNNVQPTIVMPFIIFAGA